MKAVFATAAVTALLCAGSSAAQDMHDHHVMPAPSSAAEAPDPHRDHAMSDMPAMPGMSEADHGMAMSGALGPYGMTREASGTAWQPDVSPMDGLHVMAGDWMVMSHGVLNGVYDWQRGPRGDEKGFVAGMAMVMARRSLSNGDALGFNAMLSPDPLMGKRGYPLLLAAGETANGVDPLVDRQHPHDLFMELSASYSHQLSDRDSVFAYVGLPGEPAFGPPTFMHRLSIQDSPEAPISHHWLDSTHIIFGVVTAGFVHDRWKVEVSRFKGREPDENRFDIEAPRLDSSAARLSWNPSAEWSLQASWAELKSPEQLEPERDQTRWSASAIYTRRVGDGGYWSSTAAWGRRSGAHEDLDAYVLESALKPNRAWTLFGRAERTQNDELAAGDHGHGAAYQVGKVSVGAVRDWPLSEHLSFGVGGLYAWNFVPSALEAAYGGDPDGAMAFVRLKLR